ncbi:MAG: POTRA domain-containing protein, partial [Succinivibrio sp.]
MRIIKFFILLVLLSTGISASLCQEITDIIVRTDLELVDRNELNHAIKPYIGRSIEVNVLKELLDSVNVVYHDLGYAGARAYFPEQDCTTGAIEVGVMPAEIDSVIVAAATDNQYIRDGAVSRLLGKYQEF